MLTEYCATCVAALARATAFVAQRPEWLYSVLQLPEQLQPHRLQTQEPAAYTTATQGSCHEGIM